MTKNQCFVVTVSRSKKKAVLTRPWARKSEARFASHLKVWKPAPDLSTKREIACWTNRPTMTVRH